MKNMLMKANLSKRLYKLIVELGQLDIQFLLRAAFKSQTDFVKEFSL